MKLVKALVKVLVVAGVAGGTLGGAAALGSTLWEAPPRNAAEFAQRVEAGRTHWDDVETTEVRRVVAEGGDDEAKPKKAKAKPRLRSTAAERRYASALNRACVQAEGEFRALGQPRSLTDLEGYMDRALALWNRYEARFAALEPPPRFRGKAAEMRELTAQGGRLLRRTLRAAQERDTYALLELSDQLISLGARGNELYSRMGAFRCVTDLIPTY